MEERIRIITIFLGGGWSDIRILKKMKIRLADEKVWSPPPGTARVEALSHESLFILTYLLTPWSRVVLQKLTGFAASQEIPRIYGTQKFINVFTSVRHLSLS
jgi:hypothetical protein